MNTTSERYTAEQMRDLAKLYAMDAKFADDHAEQTDSSDVASMLNYAATTLTALRAEVEALRVDAQRYRWLRDAPATSENEPIRNWLWTRPYGAHMGCLDEAIDAAIARSDTNDDA